MHEQNHIGNAVVRRAGAAPALWLCWPDALGPVERKHGARQADALGQGCRGDGTAFFFILGNGLEAPSVARRARHDGLVLPR